MAQIRVHEARKLTVQIQLPKHLTSTLTIYSILLNILNVLEHNDESTSEGMGEIAKDKAQP